MWEGVCASAHMCTRVWHTHVETPRCHFLGASHLVFLKRQSVIDLGPTASVTRSQVNATVPGFYMVSRDGTQYHMVMQQTLLTEYPLITIFCLIYYYYYY